MNAELKILGIDHLEFTCESLTGKTAHLFSTLGFHRTFEQKDKESILYAQGQARFLLTAKKTGSSFDYFKKHGEGVSKISFLVENVQETLDLAIKRGAKLVTDFKEQKMEDGVFRTGAIQGFGDVLNEFVERPTTHFRPEFSKLEHDELARPLTTRISRIDHLTNNVPHGELEHWVDFYQRIFGFKVTRYFDIKGMKTGLFSKVVQSSNNNIIIPINEPDTANGKSQIQEFLDLHKGPGVQHIALMTPDLISTVSQLWQREIKFLDVPATYYKNIPNRPFKVTEDLNVLEKNKILVDGDEQGYLLQLFSQTYVGPLFFEYIQRKNHWGFGEGNFQALFDAIEREQKERGYL
ncbi:MAG: 4-hydroxyphenylpyruvate dioxygenase [Bacteriovoracaceae bacterium]|nr:4-hydroxyphenylpyruvate dioxygenase [Bacteriovoracaceae bacterium]